MGIGDCVVMIHILTLFLLFSMFFETQTLYVTDYTKNPEVNLINLIDESDIWNWNKEDYPNPKLTPPYCKRRKESYICDPDLVLKPSEANRLDELIGNMGNGSVCICKYCPPKKNGLVIGIALMRNIFKEYNVLELQNVQNFAEFTRKKWNIGICENDMLIIIVTDDKQFSIVYGPMTQKVFPPQIGDDIFLNNKIHFVEGNYFKGLESIIKGYDHFLKQRIEHAPINENIPVEDETNKHEETNVGLVIGMAIGFVALITIIVGGLFYVKNRINEDQNRFQFKGMLSRGYWLNKKDHLKPVSVNPIISTGGVYEPCSIEDHNGKGDNDSEIDKRLREKLSQISDGSSDDEEISEIDVRRSGIGDDNDRDGHTQTNETSVNSHNPNAHNHRKNDDDP